MEPEEMTKQKWGVLRYFVENATGYKKPYWTKKCGVVYQTDAGEGRFYSYPSRIHEDFGTSYFLPQEKTSITKDWAGQICEDLCAVGVLGSEMIKAPRQSGKTPHYYLKEGYEPYIQIMKFFFEMVTDPRMQRVTMADYVQEHTDVGLVRYILHKKGAEMRRMVPLREWDAHEAPKVFEEYYRAEGRNGGVPPCSFAAYVQGQESCSPTVSLRLPVFPDGLSKKERMAAIESLNRQTFERHAWLKRYPSGILEHYERVEYERWVLPILALIRASPAALEAFLFGDWKPYGLGPGDCYCFTADGGSCMNYPLFTLLFTAVGDLAMVRDVEGDRLVERACFRPAHVASPEGAGSALLEIDLADWRRVYYDAGFNTDQRWIAVSDSDVVQPANETNYSFRSWVTIPVYRSGGAFFAPDEFPAVLRYLRHLRDTPTIAARDLFGRLSHGVQNTIATLGEGEVPADSPKGRAILRDLNELLLCDDLYVPERFPDLCLTKEGEGVIGPDPICRSSWDTIKRADFNRELLERAFRGGVPERERGEWETTRYFV